MLTETARVIAVDPTTIWVEAIRRTSCGSCSVKKACGHSLLNSISESRSNSVLVPVLVDELRAAQIQVGDDVIIGIAESTLLKAAVLVYLVPLIGVLLGALCGSSLWPGASDIGAVLGGVFGFAAGVVIVKWFSQCNTENSALHPVLISVNKAAVNSNYAPVLTPQ